MDAADEPFLATLRASPHDSAARLVYADWLEERDDPRHELLRVCERMREVPVWGDDYWRLKRRRNELWESAPLDWLEATGCDGSRYDPVFRDGVPDDVRGRWRLIREFTERWHGVSVPDAGGRRDEVAAEEGRLGLTLPESVREWMAFAHDFDGPPGPDYWPCGWAGSGHYRFGYDAVSEIVWLVDYDAESSFGVQVGRAASSDPSALWAETWPDGSVTFAAPTLTQAVSELCFTGLPGAGGAHAGLADVPHLLAQLADDFPVHAQFADADVFESDELAVLVTGPRPAPADKVTRVVHAAVRRPVSVESIPDYLRSGSLGRLGMGLLATDSGRMRWPLVKWVGIHRRRNQQILDATGWGLQDDIDIPDDGLPF